MAKVETIREKRKGKELTQVSETEDNNIVTEGKAKSTGGQLLYPDVTLIIQVARRIVVVVLFCNS